MTRARRVSGKELLRLLRNQGFEVSRVKGSHHIVKHVDGRKSTVPVHGNEVLGIGLLSSILKECELSFDDLE